MREYGFTPCRYGMAMNGACECGKGGIPNLAEGSISRETRDVKCADGKSYTGRPVIIVLPLRHGSDGGECADDG